MNGNAEKSAELVGRLEQLPFSRWHRNFFVLAFLGVMFDAADFALFGAALPPIAKEFGLGPAQAGLLATVGLGGEIPVTLTLAAEFSPGRIRGRMTGTIMAAFPVGLVVAAALSPAIVPNFGWRALFVVGIVPAVLLFFVRRYMPESVRYQLSEGKVAEAERTVAQIEREAAGEAKIEGAPRAVAEAKAETGAAAARKVTVLELLAPG